MSQRRPHLRAWLEQYNPTDPKESADHQKMLRLLDAPGDPFSRKHFDPGHFTASAFVLSPGQDALLLIFHSKLKRWLQPGGHVDPTDVDILTAAQREIAEEVGLHDLPLAQEGVFDIDIHEIPPLRGEPAHFHYDVRLLFQAQSQHHEAGSDAESARWMPFDDINETFSDHSVVRAVHKLQSSTTFPQEK